MSRVVTLPHMHEVDLAADIVGAALEHAALAGGSRVVAVRLAVGRLGGVDAEALISAYEVASRDTLLDGSRLEIRVLPVVIWCAVCLREVELDGVRSFRCPACGTAAGEIRQGKELEIESLEVDVPDLEDAVDTTSDTGEER